MAGFIADVYGGRSGNAKRGSDKRRQPVTEKPRQDQHEDDRTRALRYYNAKRYEDAERLYRQLITWSTDADGTIYPVMETHDGLDDWYRLGWNLYRQDRCPEAEPIARKLVQERENITHEALSDASLSNHTMAIETTRVKEMDSNVLLASVLDSQNKSQEAVALAQKLCSDIKSGYDHEGWHSNYLAWILLSNSVFFQAEQILRFAIAERNQLEGWEIHEAYVNLGWALNSQKRWIEAEVALSKAKEYKPYGDIWIEFARMRELSESLLGQERYDEAESQCRALLDLLRKERISRSTGRDIRGKVSYDPNIASYGDNRPS
ncbi:TPR-like protein [Lentithecium fluviatile CBS 122367]|uniref:TPR-like protein n=1 Tax=Lentithecium fluviatile CBS 122367 TaxID=1168545 RepID=A0A6G1IGI8_9PLEO|nr:TPR-like protein [Lentithecium fluviatile CBS 122367]